jgi:hypothetical protein
MALTLFSATAFAQVVITIIAIIADLGSPENTPMQLYFHKWIFYHPLGIGSGFLFWYTARKKS